MNISHICILHIEVGCLMNWPKQQNMCKIRGCWCGLSKTCCNAWTFKISFIHSFFLLIVIIWVSHNSSHTLTPSISQTEENLNNKKSNLITWLVLMWLTGHTERAPLTVNKLLRRRFFRLCVGVELGVGKSLLSGGLS